VKISDDNRARVRFWAGQPTVVALPPGPPLPKFPVQRFRTHREMNRWMEALLREITRNAPPERAARARDCNLFADSTS